MIAGKDVCADRRMATTVSNAVTASAMRVVRSAIHSAAMESTATMKFGTMTVV